MPTTIGKTKKGVYSDDTVSTLLTILVKLYSDTDNICFRFVHDVNGVEERSAY